MGEIINGWDSTGSILDCDEPVRSQSLARLGQTAEEFAAHMAAIEASVAELDAMARAGQYPFVEKMHYDEGEADLPLPVVVDD